MNFTSYKIFCPAKINLSLRIVSKDPISGYHLLETFMKKINFYDEIILKENKNLNHCEIHFSYGKWFSKFSKLKNNKTFEKIDQKNNLISKAIKFFEKYSLKKVHGFEIFCQKNIPYGSGLGGGSSNAASILKFFQQYYDYYFDFNEKSIQEKVVLEIGSDVLFFLKDLADNEIFFLKGIGHDLQVLKTDFFFENFRILIFCPYQKFNTKEMYEKFSEKNKFDNSHESIKLIDFSFFNYNAFYSVLKNDDKMEIDFFFEKTKDCHGFLCCGLSGSGSACFAIFQNQIFCENAKKKLTKEADRFLKIYKFI